MEGDTNEQTTSASDLSQEEVIRRFAREFNLSYEQAAEALWEAVDALIVLNMSIAGAIPLNLPDIRRSMGALHTLSSIAETNLRNSIFHGIDSQVGKRTDANRVTLRIGILEEPLTAQNLSATIIGITDLHARCWFIQQKRFADLMDYAQTRDSRFLKEANLQVGVMAHNSPAIIDFMVNAGSIAGGAATLAFALKKGIDAVVQTSLRFQATKLKNEREMLNQQIDLQKAKTENKAKEQEQQIAVQKAQVDMDNQLKILDLEKKSLEVDRRQFELERQQLEFEKNRVKIVLEIATTMVSQLQSDIDAGQREMIIHSLVPPLLQIATTDGLVTVSPPMPSNVEKKESSENK